MRLVKISGTYINPDRVDVVVPGDDIGTLIFLGGSDRPLRVKEEVEDVTGKLMGEIDDEYASFYEWLAARGDDKRE